MEEDAYRFSVAALKSEYDAELLELRKTVLEGRGDVAGFIKLKESLDSRLKDRVSAVTGARSQTQNKLLYN
ncbi:hypothetical protein BcepSauron_208 [Burkholderia phage BcepSauron]|uniref:Uncharacterized protein n=1 Tax=Burkholderia phage BcepSauron TaxID=2530033 RepID=A0A482MLR4_9CAUD|nr:hypothetical protein H1O17_gp208 [Burkholderia phage BcepSauron]QBQ74588.1 hypothetical protein BcepSauron_208 [Burkholderia phage BcepSauron]